MSKSAKALNCVSQKKQRQIHVSAVNESFEAAFNTGFSLLNYMYMLFVLNSVIRYKQVTSL